MAQRARTRKRQSESNKCASDSGTSLDYRTEHSVSSLKLKIWANEIMSDLTISWSFPSQFIKQSRAKVQSSLRHFLSDRSTRGSKNQAIQWTINNRRGYPGQVIILQLRFRMCTNVQICMFNTSTIKSSRDSRR